MNLFNELFISEDPKKTPSKRLLKKAKEIVVNAEQLAAEHLRQLSKEEHGTKQRATVNFIKGRKIVTLHSVWR